LLGKLDHEIIKIIEASSAANYSPLVLEAREKRYHPTQIGPSGVTQQLLKTSFVGNWVQVRMRPGTTRTAYCTRAKPVSIPATAIYDKVARLTLFNAQSFRDR
jgi:hypothetical protein